MVDPRDAARYSTVHLLIKSQSSVMVGRERYRKEEISAVLALLLCF